MIKSPHVEFGVMLLTIFSDIFVVKITLSCCTHLRIMLWGFFLPRLEDELPSTSCAHILHFPLFSFYLTLM